MRTDSPQLPVAIEAVFADGTLTDEAANEAAQAAFELHRRAGLPMTVARNGKVAWLMAEEILAESPGESLPGQGSVIAVDR